MAKDIKLVLNKQKQNESAVLQDFNLETAKKVQNFHASFAQYAQTPLAVLDNLAQELGVAKVFVKDESTRFDLESFKVLGGSYMIGTYVAQRLGMDLAELPYQRIISPEIRAKLGEITFITATDGNHGRGIAWTANQLRQKAVVYMPKGTVQRRVNKIRAQQAEVQIIDGNYDDCVRLALEQARKNGWVLTQDTTSLGYYEFPKWCMQGYTTLAYEAYQQLGELQEKPTHIFLQAGVGSMAGAVLGFFASVYGEEKPFTTIVEPSKADCHRRTAEAADGKLHIVTGEMDTIMAGLACGEPCSLSWEVLKNYADAFTACEDSLSAKGIRILANPLGDDHKVVSGESGSIGIGLLAEIMQNPEFRHLREALRLDANSKVLCFSTEGATDPENYKSIVWDGKYPSYRE